MNMKFAMTAGVDDLNLGLQYTHPMYTAAIDHLNSNERNYMTVFQPTDGETIIEDGNKNEIGRLPFEIHETVWIIADKDRNDIIFTALLPSEY